MKKPQALKFWNALKDSTEVGAVVKAYQNKRGYASASTLKRFAQAGRRFSQGERAEQVARSTGWSVPFVQKPLIWYREMEPEQAQKRHPHAPGEGPASSGTVPNRSEDEDPAQAERSDHWPGMRRAAKEARSLGSPPSQLLGFPWTFSANGALRLISTGQRVDIHLDWEQRPLTAALREHLPDDVAWTHLAQWKSQVADFSRQLISLTDWVRQQPELAGVVWVDVAEASITSGDSVGQTGITHWFPRTVVLAAVEDSGLGVDAPKGWDVQPPNNRVSWWALNWTYYSSSFVSIAVGGSEEELQSLRGVHAVLRRRLTDTAAIRALGPVNREVSETRQRLADRLERISLMPRFPGRCDLYVD